MRDPCFRPPTLSSAACVAAVVVMAAVAPPVRAENALSTVDRVDLARYLGLWYEHARLPNRMQGECARDVTTTWSQPASRARAAFASVDTVPITVANSTEVSRKAATLATGARVMAPNATA